MDDQVGHVTNEIGSETDVEEHVDHVEDLLSGVDCVEVSISDGRERHDRPVDRVGVAKPYALLLEILHLAPNPRVLR